MIDDRLNRRSNDSSTSRRSFLAGSLGLLGVSTLAKDAAAPTLDIHVHLFGIGEGKTGCRISQRITNDFQFQFLVAGLGLRKPDKTLDGEYERVLAEQVAGSGLTKVAILGQDAVYNARGQRDLDQTPWYTPSDYVFAVADRHKETMIPCPGINPDRADAVDELNRCHQKGARLFKIHPPTQGVDVSDRKHRKFFERCAALGMVVMVHTGHEHSAPVIDKHLANPKRLEFALELGCTVVACHAGTGWITDKPDQLPEFLSLLKRYPKLYGDTAVLGTPGRVRDFGRLLDAGVADRLLHGSDFPFPISPNAFAGRIDPPTVDLLAKEKNWIKKDLGLKQALGVGQASANRGFRLVCAQ